MISIDELVGAVSRGSMSGAPAAGHVALDNRETPIVGELARVTVMELIEGEADPAAPQSTADHTSLVAANDATLTRTKPEARRGAERTGSELGVKVFVEQAGLAAGIVAPVNPTYLAAIASSVSDAFSAAALSDPFDSADRCRAERAAFSQWDDGEPLECRSRDRSTIRHNGSMRPRFSWFWPAIASRPPRRNASSATRPARPSRRSSGKQPRVDRMDARRARDAGQQRDERVEAPHVDAVQLSLAASNPRRAPMPCRPRSRASRCRRHTKGTQLVWQELRPLSFQAARFALDPAVKRESARLAFEKKPSCAAAASNDSRLPKKFGFLRYGPSHSGQNVSQLPQWLQKSAKLAICSFRSTTKCRSSPHSAIVPSGATSTSR